MKMMKFEKNKAQENVTKHLLVTTLYAVIYKG